MYTFRIEQPRREYATCDDFCSVLAEDLRPLYLLAFLLTGSHAEAEQCFVATIDDCVGAKSVFKGWERSWSRRCLILNAIRIVFRASADGRGGPPAYGAVEVESQQRFAIIGLIGITPPLQRFVFVMSVLERYSIHECALLLGCTVRDVVEAQVRALTQLSEFSPASAIIHEPNRQLNILTQAHAES